MTREDVISNLAILRTWCAVNPNYGIGLSVVDCLKVVTWLDDAITLLKAQEPLGVFQKELGCTSGHVGYCPKCGAVLLENDYNPKYCGVCGQAVKWE